MKQDIDTFLRNISEETFERQISFKREDVDEDSRTAEVCFSSELEVERWFGMEILDHSPGAIMLERINKGGAVLVNHDSNDQVGVVEEARLDGDRKGRAKLRFGETARANDIWMDVKSGIRQNVSVQYRFNKYEYTEGQKSEPDVMRVLEWEPLEISIVAIPADTNAGVGRSRGKELSEAAETHKVEIDVNINQTNSERQMNDDDLNVGGDDQEVDGGVESVKRTADVDKAKLHSQGAKAERERATTIEREADEANLAELGKKAIEDGIDVSEWRKLAMEEVGKRNNEVRGASTHDGNVDLSRKDVSKFSLYRLMDAMANPNSPEAQKRAAFEFDVCDTAAGGFGDEFQARGAFIPDSVMVDERAVTVGAADSAANLVAQNLMAGSFIDVLRNSSAAMRAGITHLPGLVGNQEIPRQTSAVNATWLSNEDAEAGEDEVTFDQIELRPKDIAVFTEITRRSMQQSTPSVEGLSRSDLAIQIALGLDSAVLYGTGANGQPTGIASQSGIGTLGLTDVNPTYSELVNMVAQVYEGNAKDLGGMPYWLFEANGWEALSTTPKQASGVEGNFVLNGENVVGSPYIMSNQVEANEYFFGNFSQAILGEWGGLDLIVDETTHSTRGRVRFVMFKTADVAVRHPEAFVHGGQGIGAP